MTNAAGVDEAGRGPLAGAVIAAAVILNPKLPIDGLADSKILSAAKREALFTQICDQSLAFAIGRAEVAEIDQLNIFRASLLAMQRAILSLPLEPRIVWIDGTHCPELPKHYQATAIVRGDQTVPAISAASILAKVTRDREMIAWDETYPGYGFAQHKGYPTATHVAALKRLGPCPIHRRSFRPVSLLLG